MLRRTTTALGLVAVSALAVGVLATPASANNARSTATIWDAVVADPMFDTLQFAIEASDATQGSKFVAALSDPSANLTVFAPTNKAFEKVAKELAENAELGDGTVDTLANYLVKNELIDEVLAYHVVGADRPAASLVQKKSRSVVTLLGASITVTPDGTVRDAAPSTSNAAIAPADIRLANGRVHVINNVLVPLAI